MFLPRKDREWGKGRERDGLMTVTFPELTADWQEPGTEGHDRTSGEDALCRVQSVRNSAGHVT